MPPRQKIHRSNTKDCLKNPRVILRPFLADQSGHGRYCFTSLPSSARLFDNPELSDISLHVGNESFYAHRLILCASSDVFRNMLDDRWSDTKKQDLVLEEEDECITHFHRFLQYLYTGSIIISESYVIALYMLADKYNVRPLYEECVKIMENALKVYRVGKSTADRCTESPSPTKFVENISTTSSTSSDSSDNECSEPDNLPSLSTGHVLTTPGTSHGKPYHVVVQRSSSTNPSESRPVFGAKACNNLLLVGSETFPLNTVVKILTFCHDDRIQEVALYNLEARLSKQITNGNYGIWNDLPLPLLQLMLKDSFFYVREYPLFKAVKVWLMYSGDRYKKSEVLSGVLCQVRYALLCPQDLYQVEKDSLVRECSQAMELVNQAIRFQLFRDCSDVEERDKWTGVLYEHRVPKDNL